MTNKGIILIILCFSFFLFPNSSNGQVNEPAIIYGTITDKGGNPIADVQVLVRGTTRTTTTDANGEYSLIITPDTSITIEFSHVSFGIKLQSVNLREGEKNKSDLSIDTARTLDTVVIEDKQARANFIQPIAIKNIYVQTGVNQDFNTIIFTQLGVQQSNELSSSYSVRGGNFDENLVYVNDIEVYRPFLMHSGQQEGLSFVNSDMVSSINFSSGGFEARYGDKMSSVLDIRYTKPREFAGSVSGGLLGGSIHLEGSSNDKRFTYLVGARNKSNSYLLNSLDTKADYKPNFYDLQSYITYTPNTEWEHGFLVNASQNKYNMIPQSRKSSFGTVNEALQLLINFKGQEIDKYVTGMGAFTSTYRPYNKDLTLKFITSFFTTDESETYDVLGVYSLNELENDFGKDNFGQTAFNIGSGAMLRHARNYLNANVYNIENKGNKVFKNKTAQLWWGLKYQHETIHDKLSEWEYVDSAGYSVPHPFGNPGYINPNTQAYEYLHLNSLIKSKNTLSTNRYSGYFQNSWSWNAFKKHKNDSMPTTSSEFTLTSGIRANYWDLNKQLLISPRATLSFKPDWKSNIVFKTSAGYYYQPPFYREMRDVGGKLHTDIKAQQSIHLVLGLDKNLKIWNRPFKYIAEVYYKDLNNLIPYEIDNIRIRYYATNNAKGYARGVDMKLNGEFVKGLDSWASISIMRTMEDLNNDYYHIYLNSDGDTIISGYTSNYIITDSIRVIPGFIPRPTDQRVTFGLFFQDYLPMLPRCKMHMNLLFGTGLPFGPPSFERFKDIGRMPQYRRVDIGFSYEIVKEKEQETQNSKSKEDTKPHSFITNRLKSIWFSIEVFNLLAVNNVVSHIWVRDVNGRQYAVPNYLSNRMLNARVLIKF